MEIPKIKNRFEVVCQIENEAAEMYLYGTIAKQSWYDEESISANGVKESLKNISSDIIKVHINSGGGDVFESIAINNLLKQNKAKIEVYIDGLAGSGASIIAMAADSIFMPDNSMMMIHKASTFAYGNADELMKMVEDLNKIDTAVKASYQEKFVGTDEELTKLIADATWLTAQECKDLGFANEVIEAVAETEEPQASIKDTIVNKYKKEIPKVEVAQVETPKVEVPIVEVPEETDLNLYNTFIENFYK